mmetsp:Transcript_73376/g.195479  ORF Transcript_73376/g.195479 Transcript_73376/m.195479 type:complete len:85 (-) Transcript_73376:119-373(-)
MLALVAARRVDGTSWMVVCSAATPAGAWREYGQDLRRLLDSFTLYPSRGRRHTSLGERFGLGGSLEREYSVAEAERKRESGRHH